MELIWNECMAEQVVYCGSAQALVEGEIPQLEDRAANAILSATGDVCLLGAEAGEESIRLGGEVRLQLICMGENGVYSFHSRAAFRHTVQAEGVHTDMEVKAQPALQSMEVKLVEGRITLEAVVDMNLRVSSRAPLKALCGIEGVPDLECQGRDISFFRREAVYETVVPLREEIDAAEVQGILQSDLLVTLRDLQPGGEGVELSGSLLVSALAQKGDGSLFHLSQSLPFTERLDVVSAGPLYGVLSLEEGRMRAAEEFGLVVAEGRLHISLYALRQQEISLPQDMFSPSQAFACERETVTLSGDLAPLQERLALHETVNIPGGLPEARRVLYTAVRPVVTASNVAEGQLSIEGLLVTRILYESEAGTINAFTEDIPFTANLPAAGATEAMVTAQAVAAAGGSGRALEVNYTIQLQALLWSQSQAQAVTGLAECPPAPQPQGIIVYFAGAGETLYDVAKRFAVPVAALGAALEGESPALEEGQRLVFLR